MATWEDDATREGCRMIAGALLAAANAVDYLIQYAHPDDDITFHVDTRDMLRDRANVYAPPGEPQNGYPKNDQGKDNVVSLDAWRVWKQG